jgi:prolipoprotein diacylglyceryltransferase
VVNRLVEGHWHGFTVGGAAFAGMTFGPWLLGAANVWIAPERAAAETWLTVGMLAPAYALGEGIGRLGCISFGCCYGRPLDSVPPWLRRLFACCPFVFRGALKKAVTESHYEGRALIPIQALTAVLSTAAGLAGMALFLNGQFVAAFAVPIVTTQLWRFVSEFLRADYRGGGRVSAYQWMALTAAGAALVAVATNPETVSLQPSWRAGLAQLWTPGAFLLMQGVGLAGFLRMGVSTVTAARVELVPRP